MKEIYRFQLSKTEKIKETEIIKDDKGGDIEQTKTVEKEVPHTYVLKRPSRLQNEESEIFRAMTESDLIRRGVISVNLLQKRIINDGGVLSDEEKKERDELSKSFAEKQTKYNDLNKTLDKDKTEEDKKLTVELVKDLGDIISRINELDGSSSNLYNRTAEVLARNKSLLWLTLILSFEEKDGKLVPVFGDGDYEKKLKVYDLMEEREEPFEYKLIQKLLFNISLSFMGRATTKEEFDSLNVLYEGQNLLGG